MTRPVKRSFTIKGHRTSISIEAAFWDALLQAAAAQGTTLSALVAGIDAGRGKRWFVERGAGVGARLLSQAGSGAAAELRAARAGGTLI